MCDFVALTRCCKLISFLYLIIIIWQTTAATVRVFEIDLITFNSIAVNKTAVMSNYSTLRFRVQQGNSHLLSHSLTVRDKFSSNRFAKAQTRMLTINVSIHSLMTARYCARSFDVGSLITHSHYVGDSYKYITIQ